MINCSRGMTVKYRDSSNMEEEEWKLKLHRVKRNIDLDLDAPAQTKKAEGGRGNDDNLV